jgi:hypothetical protein
MKTKINGKESLVEVFQILSEGNPGALKTLMEVYQKSSIIDPDNILGGLGILLQFDTYNIYGSSIYILWNDQCERNTYKLLLLLRATQLGEFSLTRLKQLADDQMRACIISDEEFNEMKKKVCEILPNFKGELVCLTD